MKWWRHIPPVTRRLVAIAMLAVFADASVLGAASNTCEAVDFDGMPRDCTFSELLGECGYAAWDSWRTCTDTDGNGIQDVGGLAKAYCDFWAAADLLACSVWVPWNIIIGND